MWPVWLVVGALLVASSPPVVAFAQPSPAEQGTDARADHEQSGQHPLVGQRTTLEAYEATQPVEPTELVPVAPAPDAPTRRLWDIVKILPILFYTPETSAGFGAGMLFQFRMPGAIAERRPSSVTAGGVYTLHKQTLLQLTPELRFGDDDYVLKLDLLAAKYPNRFYGIGNDPNAGMYDTYTDCYARGELDFRLRPFAREHVLRPLFVGAHYSSAWSAIRDVKAGHPDHESMFAQINDPGERALFASGVGVSLAWDSRDGLNWPRNGNFIELKGTAFDPTFGSDVRYQRLVLDARRYQPLWWEHVLAMRFVLQSVWGDVPFQRLPQLGGASMFRGWYSGQLRGRQLIAVEAEYRMPLGKRWAVVAFGSAGRVTESLRSNWLRDIHVAGGGGLRFSVDKRDRVNIRLDLAYGDDFYPYLQFREAF